MYPVIRPNQLQDEFEQHQKLLRLLESAGLKQVDTSSYANPEYLKQQAAQAQQTDLNQPTGVITPEELKTPQIQPPVSGNLRWEGDTLTNMPELSPGSTVQPLPARAQETESERFERMLRGEYEGHLGRLELGLTLPQEELEYRRQRMGDIEKLLGGIYTGREEAQRGIEAEGRKFGQEKELKEAENKAKIEVERIKAGEKGKEKQPTEQDLKDRLSSAETVASMSKNVTADSDRALKVLKNWGWASAGVGSLSKGVYGTPAKNLTKLIESVQSNIGIDTLLNIKKAGSGLGQVPQKQLEMLASVLGKLDTDKEPNELAFDLQRVKDIYQNILNKNKNEIRDIRRRLGYKVSEDEIDFLEGFDIDATNTALKRIGLDPLETMADIVEYFGGTVYPEDYGIDYGTGQTTAQPAQQPSGTTPVPPEGTTGTYEGRKVIFRGGQWQFI